MTTPRSLQAKLDEWEQKGLIRRVRTAEGARKYGQPIGSVIVVDKVKRGRQRTSRVKVVENDTTVLDNRATDKRTGFTKRPKDGLLDFTPAEAKAATKWTDASGNWLNDFLYADNEGVHVRIDNFVATTGQYSIHIRDTRTRDDFQFRADTLEQAKQATSVWLKSRHDRLNKQSSKVDKFGRRHRNRKKRDYPGFFDAWEGTRGWDFQYEDDPELDMDDYYARIDFATKDAAEMGVEWGQLQKRPYTTSNVDPNGMEAVNSVYRVHEEYIPGFSRLLPKVGLDTDSGTAARGAIAWNGLAVQADSQSGTWKFTGELGLPMNYWSSERNPSMFDKLDAVSTHSPRSKEKPIAWHAVDVDRIAEEQGIDTWRAQMLATTTHEFGHSIARILFNDFYLGSQANRPELNENDNEMATVGTYFRHEFIALLDDFGVIDFDEFYADAPTVREQNESMNIYTKNSHPTLRHDVLKEHLSVYGAVNFHEMMAETWAAYMMDPEPGDFVRELGSLMEDAVNMWISETEAMEAG